MATAGERRILGFLVAMALIGTGVRAWGVERFERSTLGGASAMPASGAARALAAQRAAVDSARRAPRPSRASRGPRTAQSPQAVQAAQPRARKAGAPRDPPVFPIDINAATAVELEVLPRVGPAMARRIVERRERAGPYQTLDDLRHVRGIGPATLRLLDSLVTFSGRHRPLHSGEPPPSAYHPAYVSGRKSRHYGCSCCIVGESHG